MTVRQTFSSFTHKSLVFYLFLWVDELERDSIEYKTEEFNHIVLDYLSR
jgi:hypothetical protein